MPTVIRFLLVVHAVALCVLTLTHGFGATLALRYDLMSAHQVVRTLAQLTGAFIDATAT